MPSNHSSLQTLSAKADVDDALEMLERLPEGPLKTTYYKLRLDPSAYLGRAFMHSLTLMAAMFDTGCILSGSRALEYFLPGSATPESDWDFYVPGYRESVIDMVAALSLAGVEWNLATDAITSALHTNGKVRVPSRTLDALNSWIMHLPPASTEDLMGPAVVSMVQLYKQRRQAEVLSYCFIQDHCGVHIHNECDGSCHNECESSSDNTPLTQDSSYECPFDGLFSVLQGKIQTEQGPQGVQLIIGGHYGNVRTCTSLISSFYASHVQCFLSGWCAGHMYYRQTKQRKANLWLPKETSQKITAAVTKYEKRGYIFNPANPLPSPEMRNLKDKDAFFLEYSNIYESALASRSDGALLSSWLVGRRDYIKAIYWTDIEGKVRMLILPEPCVASHKMRWSHLARLADMVSRATDNHRQLFSSCVSESRTGQHLTPAVLARSGVVFDGLPDAPLWSWSL